MIAPAKSEREIAGGFPNSGNSGQESKVPEHAQKQPVSLHLFAAYLTEQYAKTTNLAVKVHGDELRHTLIFDCSSDPEPERVCSYLFEHYPQNASERWLLANMKVKELVFDPHVPGRLRVKVVPTGWALKGGS